MHEEWRGIIQKKKDGAEIVNYNDESFPVYLYQGWLLPDVTWSRVAHWHDELEIVTVTCGEIGYNVNGDNIRLHEGDTLIVNSRQLHFSIPVNEYKDKYNLCIIDPILLCGCFSIADRYVRPIVDNKSLPYILIDADSDEGKAMYRESYAMMGCMNDNFAINAQFFNMWKIVIEYCKKEHALDEKNEADPALLSIRKMLNYSRANFDKAITLDDISGAGGVSRTYCNQLFHKYTSRSPMDNLMRYRAERAAEYLEHSTFSMAEIARKTGFTGASYMSEIFKRYYNVSPREYRKNASSPEKANADLYS